jgi:hypothetical protein
MFGVPALRMRMLDNFLGQVELIGHALAARAGRDPDDPEMRVLAGAITGAIIVALSAWQSEEAADMTAYIDRALAVLEPGPL